ncbi:hypothetical protein BDV26DRAFT_284211 [Aspergillus bertholletiae]|uniref:Uncharacterized protein n=1 Tax=Aspergillus bertholletiae TaxID=1226010 RepID=A0A5N7B087_9EURO|nr:hypothetical protein BDV26DRAFT_284211 [Aspergillus bertholletiae]
MTADPRSKSLRDLIRHHRDFIADPLLWVSRHLDLVGCRFEVADVDPGNAELPENLPEAQGHAEQLARNIFPVMKHRALVSMLAGKGRSFAKHHSHSLVGYFHYTDACPDPRRHPNIIGGSIYNKRLAQITPPERIKDPYFVCLLLALAQLQERKLSRPPAYTVCHPLIGLQSRLLVIHAADREYIYLYEAEITTELLSTLRNTSAASSNTEWPTIRRLKISFQPYKTFANWLIAALVSPIPQCPRNSLTLPDKVGQPVAKRSQDEESSRSPKVRRIL